VVLLVVHRNHHGHPVNGSQGAGTAAMGTVRVSSRKSRSR
jgi:hypothetical protein